MDSKQLNNFIETIQNKLSNINELDNIIELLLTHTKEIVPYDSIDILFIDREKNQAKSYANKNKYSLIQSGLLTQCYQSHQPIIINDIQRSILFNKDVDNLDKSNIMKVLLIPILDNNSSKDILGMIWIGINKGYKQFIQKDVDTLVRFTNSFKHKIFKNIDNSGNKYKNPLELCMEEKKKLIVDRKRDENYFASTIHDIRTPMNAVIGYMELMLMTEKDEKKREYIESTLKNGELMVTLINDALDMSKVSNGKMTINKTLFSPIEILSDVVKLFYNSMKQKSIYFDIYIDPLMPSLISSDTQRIKQIINNLLSNAIKFTPQYGEITLNAKYDKNNDTLKVSIKDNGIGIEKEKQKSIFNPYAQETNSTSKEYGGTGLGLSISQQLSILLNGKLTLEGDKGKGSDFSLIIPCETPKNTKPEIDTRLIENQHIIIFSPHINSNLKTFKTYFDELDISYQFTVNIEMLDEKHIIIMDKKETSNYEKYIKDLLKNSARIIVINSDINITQCTLKGNLEILQTPILPNILIDKISKLINPNIEYKLQSNIEENRDKLKNHNVLVIDDSTINLKLMVEILKHFQAKIQTAINPKEAFTLMEKTNFDIIFIDQNMPIMNGDKATIIIREMEKKKNIKPSIIYGLTGDSNDETITNFKNAGANDIFIKPIHIEEIYNSILKVDV